MIDKELAMQYSYDLLGPLFYRFCYKLHLSQSCFSCDDTHILFVSRGGVRLRFFYECFLKANNIKEEVSYSDFYISRMAAVKSALIKNSSEAVDYLAKEYAYYSLRDMFKAFLSEVEFNEWLSLSHGYDLNDKVNVDSIRNAIFGSDSGSLYLHGVFERQSEQYLAYLESKVGRSNNILVVDTGWSGSIVNFMMKIDPDRNYLGVFFGRYNYGKAYPSWFRNVVGLEVQAFNFNPKVPITSVFLNRHLIEGVCEIRWNSVSGYKSLDNSEIVPFEGIPPEGCISPGKDELQAIGIQKYIELAADALNFELIDKKANIAAGKLYKKILYPNPCEAKILSTFTRSADFGKDIDVPYFVPPLESFFPIKSKLEQAGKSLWHAGQLALEFGSLSFPFQYYYHWKKRSAAKKRSKLNK